MGALHWLSWNLPGGDKSAPGYKVRFSTKGGAFFMFQVYERVAIFQVPVSTKDSIAEFIIDSGTSPKYVKYVNILLSTPFRDFQG